MALTVMARAMAISTTAVAAASPAAVADALTAAVAAAERARRLHHSHAVWRHGGDRLRRLQGAVPAAAIGDDD